MKIAKLAKTPEKHAAVAGAILVVGILSGCSSPKASAHMQRLSPLPPSPTIVLERVDDPRRAVDSMFAEYDAAAHREVGKRWYKLIEEASHRLKPELKGKVVLEFRLLSNGRVVDMLEPKHDVDVMRVLLCQKAVLDCSPFPKWPEGTDKKLGANYRRIRFTFNYN